MKKSSLLFLAVAALVLLSACGKTEATTDKSLETRESSSAAEKAKAAVYEGELSENATEEEDGIVKVTLKNVKGNKDPQNILDSMKDGVVLHVPKELLAGVDLATLTIGGKISFSLKEPVIMTRSLPPQIPGDSVEMIQLIK